MQSIRSRQTSDGQANSGAISFRLDRSVDWQKEQSPSRCWKAGDPDTG
ncbi:hypothetical protein [Mariprofundus erugo]|nr:hypothetical protein [Mariprofundus erugo]